MLKLTKPVAIAIQASLGVALSAPLAATALAEGASANAAARSQATPVLRGGDLVRLRSGGPALTVKSVHGDWVICTWWHEGFGQFRTIGFPMAMVDGPIAVASPGASPQTDVSPQASGQASPPGGNDRSPGDLSAAGQNNQNPTGQSTNQTLDVGGMTSADARMSVSRPTTPAQALRSQPGSGQANQNPIAQAANQTIDVGRVRPALVVLPSQQGGGTQLILTLQQGTIDGAQARPTLVLPQGTVQTVLPLQQGVATSQTVAATNQTVGAANQTVGATNQTIAAGPTRAANARAAMSPQGAIGRRF
jgi:uncharacterized protein YodC (DUF2158 family)